MRPSLPTLPLLALLGAVLGACSASSSRVSPDGSPSEKSPSEEASGGGAGSAELPPSQAPPVGELLSAELTTVGWDQLSGAPMVLLRELDSGQVLPIWIGIAEARAINLELHGVELQRPMTHDLMANLLRSVGATLEQVVVHDLRDGTYYGLLKLRLAGQPEPRWVDSRPSDGLALALRTDAEIRISRKLLDNLPDYDFLAPDTREQVVRVLGLTVVAVDESWRRELSLPERPGIVVIATAGEARRRGLRRGDLIVALAGEPADEPLDLLHAIAGTPVGEALEVRYWRDGEEHTTTLSLEVPEPPSSEGLA